MNPGSLNLFSPASICLLYHVVDGVVGDGLCWSLCDTVSKVMLHNQTLGLLALSLGTLIPSPNLSL